MLLGGARAVTLTTWFARAFICADARLARRKERVWFQLLLKDEITMVQETHGSRDTLNLATGRFTTTHVACTSPAAVHGAGGTMTLVSRSFLRRIGAAAAPAELRSDTIVQGRIYFTEM